MRVPDGLSAAVLRDTEYDLLAAANALMDAADRVRDADPALAKRWSRFSDLIGGYAVAFAQARAAARNPGR